MTNKNINNMLVILAGGVGRRFKSIKPKQYTLIKGKELIIYSIEEMQRCKNVDRIIVVLNDDKDRINNIKNRYDVDVIVGGKERANSFQNAIDFTKTAYGACKKIVFHEAARPLVRALVIDKYFDLLEEYDYVETCKKIDDSLGSYVIKAPRREDYYLIQAPEAYRFSVLQQYYDCNSPIYFAANQFPSFVKGFQYFDIVNNFKLTKPEDKVLIEYLLSQKRGLELTM